MMEALWQDLRYAARSFARKPGYALVVVLTLALGIGVVSAVFSFFNAALLRQLPYERSERLAQLQSTESEKAGAYFSHPDFIDLRDQSQSFERMAAVRSGRWTLIGDGDAERLPGARVSAEFFPMLGVKPAPGRVFRSEEDRPGAERVVMLHHNLWRRPFGGDPQSASLVRAGARFGEIYHQNNKNLQPRLGFAWDPFRHGKTVARGAYAVLVDQPMTSMVTGASANPPLALPLTFTGTIRFDNAINLVLPAGLAPQTVDHGVDNTYMQSWNFNVQRELTPELAVMWAISGRRAHA